jgi:hypothetical protein
MKSCLFIACTLSFLNSFGQSAPGITLKIIPSSFNPQYQEPVEYKAWLYNRSKVPVKIVNPNHSEPAWRLYKDEWTVLDATGKKVNPRDFLDGASSPFGEKDVTVIKPGDSLYVRYLKFKFENPGKYSIKYVLDHNPAYSTYYKDKKPANTLTVFKAESNVLLFDIKKQEVAPVKAAKLLSYDDLRSEKNYTSVADAFANAENVYKLRVADIKQEDFNSICKLKNLRTLEVSGAAIDSFPADFSDLKLLSLRLGIRRSNQHPLLIPRGIGKMNELTSFTIDGGDNMLFPEEFNNLRELGYFAVISCNFERLPAGMANFKKMSSFLIRYNHTLSALPAGMSEMTTLRSVEISDCNLLKQFPPVFQASNLSNLSLSNNSIGEIPADIANLKALNYLVMENNKLTSLPPQLLELPALQLLNVRGNTIAKDDGAVKSLQKKMAKSFFK